MAYTPTDPFAPVDGAPRPFESGTQDQEQSTLPRPSGLFSDLTQKRKLETAATKAAEQAPDRAARIFNVARRTGLPTEVIDRKLDDLEREVAAPGFDPDEFRKRSPLLADWLAKNPYHLAVAQDDLRPLAGIENALAFTKSAVRSAGAALMRRGAGLWGAVQAGTEATMAVPGLEAVRPDLVAQGAALAAFARESRKVADHLADRIRGDQAGLSTTQQAILGGFESIGLSLSALPLAWTPAGAAAMLTDLGLVAGGEAYGEARDAGVSVPKSLAYGLGQGGVEALTERIPAKWLLMDLAKSTPLLGTALKQLMAEVPGEQVATIFQDLNTWAVLNPDKPFMEYLKERPERAYQTLVSTLVAVGGTSTLASVLNRVANGKPPMQKALEDIGAAAAESKLRDRSPEKYAEAIDAAVKNGVEELSVPVEQFVTYWQEQGEDPARVAEAWTGDPGALARAEATGALNVPTARYITQVAHTEHNTFFAGEVRDAANPRAMSAREELEFENREVERQRAAAPPADASDVAFRELRATLMQRIQEGGQFDQAAAEAYADTVMRGFRQMAVVEGVDIREVAAKWMPQIESIARRRARPAAPRPAIQAPGTEAAPVFETGKPVTFQYLRNTEKAPDMGAEFGQDVEPAGRYMVVRGPGVEPPDARWQTGTIAFQKPLVVPVGEGTAADPTNWKRALSAQYGGLTGAELSAAIQADGYDGIVTVDKYGTSEVVALPGTPDAESATLPLDGAQPDPAARPGLSDGPAERGAAGSERPDAGTGVDRGAGVRGLAAIPAQDTQFFQQLADGAAARGFTGTPDDLAAKYLQVRALAREGALDRRQLKNEHGPAGLLQAVATAGGISTIEEGGGKQGEIEAIEDAIGSPRSIGFNKRTGGVKATKRMPTSKLPGIDGPIVTRLKPVTGDKARLRKKGTKNGLSLDGMFEYLNQNGFPFDSLSDMIEAIIVAVDAYLNTDESNLTNEIHDVLWSVMDVRPDTDWWDAYTFEQGLFEDAAARRAERQGNAERLAAAGEPVPFVKADGRSALAGPDMSKPGMFRLTRIDADGSPVGHTEHATLLEAIEVALQDGYVAEQQPALPGAEDVREQELDTPEFDLPFALTPPPVRRRRGDDEAGQETLFQRPGGDVRDLVIQHNLTIENLLHAGRMGGLAAPSLAVVQKDRALDNFGEITLLGPQSMADPRGGSGTRVFGADIYSPRYPTIHYKYSDAAQKQLRALVAKHMKATGLNYYDLDQAQKEGVRFFDYFTPLMAEFMEQRGLPLPEPVVEPDRPMRDGIGVIRGGVDHFGTRNRFIDAIERAKLGPAFTTFAAKYFDSLKATERIFRGFTDMGNRRYQPHTLENVVKILKKELRGGESAGNIYGVGQLRSKFAPEFKSLKAIREAKGRLVSDEDFDTVKAEVEDEMLALRERMAPYNPSARENFRLTDQALAVMEESRRLGLDRALREYGFEDVPADVKQDIYTFMDKLRNMPTEYFEAKILRGVDIGEFRAAIVPDHADPEVFALLNSRGVEVFTYGRQDDRQKVIADAAEQLGEEVLFQAAWHGSPHLFDRFSLHAIGTGEGAQAYGWGLYFAGRREVAEYYRDVLTERRASDPAYWDAIKPTLPELTRAEWDRLEYLGRKMSQDGNLPAAEMAEWRVLFDKKLAYNNAVEAAKPKGRLFKVEIPESEDYLDWDRPASQQSEKVQAVLRELGVEWEPFKPKTPAQFLRWFESKAADSLWREDIGIREALHDAHQMALAGQADALNRWQEEHQGFFSKGMIDPTGRSIYESLKQQIRRDTSYTGPLKNHYAPPSEATVAQSASEKLAALGVAGIRYLDGSSRNKGEGSHNFVVFDDKLVQIMEFEQQARGSITFRKGDQPLIRMFEARNLSTFFHESGHLFLKMMGSVADPLRERDPATLSPAQRQLLADYDATLKRLGVDSTASLTGNEQANEQFAREFEAYLMEGKAPSVETRRTFGRARAWLLAIYKDIRGLSADAGFAVKINPEVRAIFDRLLASDAEIAEAEAEAGVDVPMFTSAEEAGWTPEVFDAYKAQRQRIADQARERVQVQVLKEMERERRAWWKDTREAVREEVSQAIFARREYKALAAIVHGTNPDGSPFAEDVEPVALKMSRQEVVKAYGKAAAVGMPRGTLTSNNGLHPDVLAEMFDYANGLELLNALRGLTPMAAAIDIETDRVMKERHGDMLTDGSLADRAREAVLLEDARVNVVEAELGALTKLARQIQPGIQATQRAERGRERAGRQQLARIPTRAALQRVAQRHVAESKVGAIRPLRHFQAARQAAVKAMDLVAAKDYEGALRAKVQHLLNLELYREAVAAVDAIDAARTLAAKMLRPDADVAKTRNMDYVAAARAIVARYFFPARQSDAFAALAKVKEFDPELHDMLVDQVTTVLAIDGTLRDLTFEQFVGMRDAVAALWEQARRSEQIEVAGERIARGEAIAQLAARMDDMGVADEPQPHTERQMYFLGMKAAIRRVEHWVRKMDGGRFDGAFRRFLLQPIVDGTTAYRTAKGPELQRFLDTVKGVEKTLVPGAVPAPELAPGFAFENRGALLHALLHSGNESNLRKLLLGYKWGRVTDAGDLDESRWWAFVARAQQDGTLTQADYEFVQAVWNQLEALKPQAQRAHREMYGHTFAEITARPIDTPWGTYAGGYVPAIADPLQVPDAAIRDEKHRLSEGDNAHMFPTTGRGFTKSRTGYAKPLKLDLRMIPQHIDKVLRFIHIEPRVKDVARLVWDPRLRTRLDALDPTAASDMLVPWLQRAATQKVATPSKGWGGRAADTFFREVRTRTGLGIMTANVVNTLQQFTGLSIARLRVKRGYLRNALWTIVKDPAGAATFITDNSPWMAGRVGFTILEQQNAIEDLLLNPSKYDKVRDFAKRHGYFMQAGTQSIVDKMTWLARYEQSIAEGSEHRAAVLEADAAVRETQGSFAAEDVSRVETGTPFMRSFTMFFSYFNMQANILGTDFNVAVRQMGLRKGAGRALFVYTFGFMIPAVLSEMLRQGAGGFDDDDDESHLDEFMAIFFGSQARTAAAMVPFAGQIALALGNTFNDKPYDDRISTSPAITTIETAYNAPRSVYEAMMDPEKSKKRAIKDTLTLLSLLTGVPFAAAARPLGYLADVEAGVEDPDADDMVRGLITGRSQRER